MDMPEKNINYPAAYIVNGESSTVSVIKLADNTVAETIELMTSPGNMAMWPHHASVFSIFEVSRIAIGVPGTDLSAGHAGNMGGMKGKVLIIDGLKGTIIKNLEVPAMNHNAAFSPDGCEIWTSQMEMEGKVLVFDAQNYTLKNTIRVGMEPAEVTFSADGTKAYVANGGDNTVSVIDPASKAILATIPVGENPVGAWVGFDGKMYLDNEDGQSISVIDVATNAVVQTIPLGFMPGSAAHLASKKELWVTDPDNGQVHFWTLDASGNQWVHGGKFQAGAGAHAVAFTSDGSTAYVTNQLAASVSVLKVADHVKIKDIPVGKKPNGIVIKQ
ncbi:beta-propeller fold lactonase family protein [Chitinophaga cymbidii]|nr:beta-propeller fold lactonase family protein [Chitinophaga cymbidii]